MEKVMIFETPNAINYHVAKGVEVLHGGTELVSINLTLDNLDSLHVDVTCKDGMEHFSGRIHDVRSLDGEQLEKAVADEFESLFVQYHVRWAVLSFQETKELKNFLHNLE